MRIQSSNQEVRPDLLVKLANVRTWEALEMLNRDAKHLGELIPSPRRVLAAVPAEGMQILHEYETLFDWSLHDFVRDVEAALRLNEESVGSLSSRYLGRRNIYAQMAYAIANRIQTRDGDFTIDDRQEINTQFFLNLRRFESENLSEEAQREVVKFEELLGHLFVLRTIAVMSSHSDITPEELTLAGLRKYGVPDKRGLQVCNWDSGIPCACGMRKDAMKADLTAILPEFADTFGLLEMDEFMYLVYGMRNSAISPLTGAVRAFIEVGAELGYMELAQEAGSYDNLRSLMGPIYLDGSRLDYTAMKEVASGKYTVREGVIFEAADGIVSWPPLVAIAFGLSPSRSMARGLTRFAQDSGIELSIPAMFLPSGTELTL